MILLLTNKKHWAVVLKCNKWYNEAYAYSKDPHRTKLHLVYLRISKARLIARRCGYLDALNLTVYQRVLGLTAHKRTEKNPSRLRRTRRKARLKHSFDAIVTVQSVESGLISATKEWHLNWVRKAIATRPKSWFAVFLNQNVAGPFWSAITARAWRKTHISKALNFVIS